MSLALVTAAAILATTGTAVSLWRGAARRPGPGVRAYRWFALAAALVGANVILGRAVTPAPGGTMLSFADLPALLVLPVVAAGLAALASAARAGAPEARRRGLLAVGAFLADGYVLAAGLFLIGWVTLFGAAYTRSGAAPGFAADLVHPVADLLALWVTLPLAQVAGRRAMAPFLALVAVTGGDSASVGARVAGTHPGAGAVAAQFTAAALLALVPWADGIWPPAARWLGSTREVTTAVAAATATVAALLAVAQAITTGHLTGLVEMAVLGTTAAVLAMRVVSLLRRMASWSRVWQDSGRQFRQVAERTSDVVLLCDSGGAIRYASQAAAGYGYTPAALRGTPLVSLLHPEDQAAGVAALRRAMTGSAERDRRYPCRVRAEDGTWRHVQATLARYRDPGQPDLVLVTARDMSAQVALRRQVTHLTFHDALTGLPNRAYAEQRARDVLSAAPGGARPGPGVIVVDIDGFTAVNEAYGHAAGDLLLAQVARRLRLAVSPQDTIARWGGDEFAVLTEGAVTAAELVDCAERLARGVASLPFRVGDSELAVTASAGAALAAGGPAAHTWRDAEMALARAKASGAGRVELFGASRGDDGGPAGEPGAEAGAGAGDLGPVSYSETKLLSG